MIKDDEKEALTAEIGKLKEQTELLKKQQDEQTVKLAEATKAAEDFKAKYEQLSKDYLAALDNKGAPPEKTLDDLIADAIKERKEVI